MVSSTGRTVRIVSPCSSLPEFLEAFRGYANDRSIFIPTPSPRRAGTTSRFRIELDTGESILIGTGTVTEAFPDDTNSFGASGMKIEFSILDDRGEKVFAQIDPSAPPNGRPNRTECALLEETITTMAFPALAMPVKKPDPESPAQDPRTDTMKVSAQNWQPPALRSVPSIPARKTDPPAFEPKLPGPIAAIAARAAPVPPPPGLARRPTPSPVTPLPGLMRRAPSVVPPLPGMTPSPTPAPVTPAAPPETGPFVTVIGDDYGKAPIDTPVVAEAAAAPKLVPNPPKLPVPGVATVKPVAPAKTGRAVSTGWGDTEDWKSSPATNPYDAFADPESTQRDGQSPLISGELLSQAVLPESRTTEDEAPTETTSAPPVSRGNALGATMPMSALPMQSPGVQPPPPQHDDDDTDQASEPAARAAIAAAHEPPVPVYPTARDPRPARIDNTAGIVPEAAPPPATGRLVRTAAISGILAMVTGLVMGYLIWGSRAASPSRAETTAPAAATAAEEPSAADKAPAPPVKEEKAAIEPPEEKAVDEKAVDEKAVDEKAVDEKAVDEPAPPDDGNLATAEPAAVAVAEKAVPATCSVSVTSKPAAAIVFSGKTKLGITPFEGPAPCGALSLKLKKKYFQDTVAAVTTTPGDAQGVAVTLERKKASIRVISIPAGAAVSINGKRTGSAPTGDTFPAGTRLKLKLDKPGFKPWLRSLTIEKTTRIEAKLDPVAPPPKPKPAPPKPPKKKSKVR